MIGGCEDADLTFVFWHRGLLRRRRVFFMPLQGRQTADLTHRYRTAPGCGVNARCPAAGEVCSPRPFAAQSTADRK